MWYVIWRNEKFDSIQCVHYEQIKATDFQISVSYMTCKLQWEKLLHHIINPEIIWYSKIGVRHWKETFGTWMHKGSKKFFSVKPFLKNCVPQSLMKDKNVSHLKHLLWYIQNDLFMDGCYNSQQPFFEATCVTCCVATFVQS